MAEKEVLITTEVLAKESTQTLQALSSSVMQVVSSVEVLLQASVRLTQADIAVRNAKWGVIDAQRSYIRLALQQVELDSRQADLSLKMAERQAMITMRTGRRLDVEQALLNVEKAKRDVALTNFDIETQRVKVGREQITAAEQLAIMLKYQEFAYRAVLIQIMASIVQTTILIGLLMVKIQALIAERAVASMGATLAPDIAIAAGAFAAAGGITAGIYQAVKPDAPSSGPSYNNTTNYNVERMDQGTYNYIQDRETMYQQTGGGRRSRSAT